MSNGILDAIPLWLSFALAVLLTIRDLDQPARGWLRVSQRPMAELQRKLHASEEPTAGARSAAP